MIKTNIQLNRERSVDNPLGYTGHDIAYLNSVEARVEATKEESDALFVENAKLIDIEVDLRYYNTSLTYDESLLKENQKKLRKCEDDLRQLRKQQSEENSASAMSQAKTTLENMV